MKASNTGIYFLVFIAAMSLTTCNETEPASEKNDSDTTAVVTKTDTPSMPAYDPAMEPLTVGAKFSKKLHDTLNVKMYVTTAKPGDSLALHTHPDHAVYVLQGGKLAVYFNGTNRTVMDFKTGTGFVSGPLSDAAVNVGKTTIKLLIQDVYRPRGTDISSYPGYDQSKDPFTVGGSSCKLIHDSLNIKMFECSIKPGESAALHTHPDHSIYVLQGGKVAFTPVGGTRQEESMPTGAGWIGGPVSDSAKNTGKTTIKVLETDFYRPR